MCEYLFCQHGIFGGEGVVLLQTLLIPKRLLKWVPFKKGNLPHGDWEWLLQVERMDGVGIEFVQEAKPLVIWNREEKRPRMSNRTDWKYSLSWLESNQHLFTKKAYTSFMMTQVSLHAARVRDWKAFWILPYLALQKRRPRLIDLLAHFVIWWIPLRMRTKCVILYDQIKSRL